MACSSPPRKKPDCCTDEQDHTAATAAMMNLGDGALYRAFV